MGCFNFASKNRAQLFQLLIQQRLLLHDSMAATCKHLCITNQSVVPACGGMNRKIFFSVSFLEKNVYISKYIFKKMFSLVSIHIIYMFGSPARLPLVAGMS